jgi:uncharacterized membrane protein
MNLPNIRSTCQAWWQTASLAEESFRLVGLFIGLSFLVVSPPFQVADEPAHFYRAYQISQLHILPTLDKHGSGGFLPINLVRTTEFLKGAIPFHPETKVHLGQLKPYFFQPLNPQATTMTYFENTAIYSPVAYLPQSIALAFGRLLQLSPLMLMYLGRLASLVMWIFLTALAIRLAPIGKWAFFSLAVTPMIVFQAASLSSDGFLNGLAFLFVALVLRYTLAENTLLRRDLIILAVLSCLLALCKIPAFLLPLLLCIIPAHQFASLRQKYLFLVFTALITLALTGIWYILTQSTSALISRKMGNAANPMAQLTIMIHHPLGYIYTLYETLLGNANGWVVQFAGQLGWLDTNLSTIGMVASYLLIALGLLYDDRVKGVTIKIFNWQRSLSALIFTTASMAMITILYLSWSPLRGHAVDGMQGRYFIPFSPLTIPMLSKSPIKVTANPRTFAKFMATAASLILILALIFTLDRYYVTFNQWIAKLFPPY